MLNGQLSDYYYVLNLKTGCFLFKIYNLKFKISLTYYLYSTTDQNENKTLHFCPPL